MNQFLHLVVSGDGLKARLVREGLGSAGIQATNRVLALALGIVLARSLGADGYGVYAYAFSIMSLLMVVAEAGVPTLLMREIAASQGCEEWGLLRGALSHGVKFVGLVATSVSVFGLLVLWWRADDLAPPVLYTTRLMLFVLPVSALCKTVAHAMSGLHRVVIGQAVDMLVRPVLVLVLVGTGFMLWPNLREPYYAMTAQFVAATIVLLVGALILRRFLPAATKTLKQENRRRNWLRSALPFVLIGGAGVLNNNTDIIMLGWFTGSEEVGIYRVAVQGATLVAFSLQVANAVVAPQFTRLYAKGDMARLQHLVTQSARVVLSVALPIALVFILVGGILISGVFGAEFVAAYGPLAILASGQLVNAGFGSGGFLLYMTGHERTTARILCQTTLLNILLNVVFIPLYGLGGAATATAIALVVWNALLYRQVRQLLGISSTVFRVKTI